MRKFLAVVMCVLCLCLFVVVPTARAGFWCDMASIAGGYHPGLNVACALEFFFDIGAIDDYINR